MQDTLQQQIRHGCSSLSLELDTSAIKKLAAYVELLGKWNRVYNLTAVRDPQQMVLRHVLDSLVVIPFLTYGHLLDVGTGAGLPGLPIAIARPDLTVIMLDSSDKKIRFVRQAVAELQLDNSDVVHARMQEYRPAQPFDMVISRAVATLDDLYQDTRHLLKPGGRMLFMKGAVPEQELQALPQGGASVQVEKLTVPGLEEQRHLLWLTYTTESQSTAL